MEQLTHIDLWFKERNQILKSSYFVVILSESEEDLADILNAMNSF